MTYGVIFYIQIFKINRREFIAYVIIYVRYHVQYLYIILYIYYYYIHHNSARDIISNSKCNKILSWWF